MNRPTLLACVAATLLSGCATRSAVHQVAEDLRAVHAEIDLFRKAQDDLSRRIAELEASTRASQTRADELHTAMASTVSDVERLVTQLDQTHEAMATMRETLAASAAAVPPPPSPAPPSPPATPPASSSPPSTPPPERPREASLGSAETKYAAGLVSFRAREYGQAVLDFLDVVTKHRSHALAPSAQYWIGEAYYLQHDYRQALLEFERVLDWGSTNGKVPEALVKAGLCHSYLREGSRAEEAWRRVVRDFPESSSAEEARKLLAGKGPVSPARRP
jgi:tol-pal system protein YbgF